MYAYIPYVCYSNTHHNSTYSFATKCTSPLVIPSSLGYSFSNYVCRSNSSILFHDYPAYFILSPLGLNHTATFNATAVEEFFDVFSEQYLLEFQCGFMDGNNNSQQLYNPTLFTVAIVNSTFSAFSAFCVCTYCKPCIHNYAVSITYNMVILGVVHAQDST